MIVLAGRVTTPVPNRPYIFTGVPVSRVATVLPGVPHVKARLPGVPRVGSKLPSAPHYRTRRPPTKNRLVAGNTTVVSGSAVVHARLGVEFAEQSVQVDQAGNIAVGLAAVSAVGVSGSALVRALYRVDASNAAGVAGSGVARARHTLAASQAIATTTDGGDARALYSLTAAQNIVVVQPVESRPFIDVAASQDVGVVSAASSVPSVGTVNADATQDIGVDSAATVRVRHAVNATQEIVSGESTVLDGLRVPLAASQGVAVVGSGDARALYTLPASQALVASGAGVVSPSLAASGSVGVDGTGTSRARHTLAASSSAIVDSAATASAASYLPITFGTANSAKSTTGSTISTSITTTAGATAILLVNGAATAVSATCDGNPMTLLGSESTFWSVFVVHGLGAGNHTFTANRVSGATGLGVAVASYNNVASATLGAVTAGTSNTPSMVDAGAASHEWVVGCFTVRGSEASGITATEGTVRQRDFIAAADNRGYVIADRSGPGAVTLATSSSYAWRGVPVRLIPTS